MNKRRSKNEWQRLIDEQAASDLTQKAFCAQAGICGSNPWLLEAQAPG